MAIFWLFSAILGYFSGKIRYFLSIFIKNELFSGKFQVKSDIFYKGVVQDFIDFDIKLARKHNKVTIILLLKFTALHFKPKQRMLIFIPHIKAIPAL